MVFVLLLSNLQTLIWQKSLKTAKHTILSFSATSLCVAPFHCRPKPLICHLKPVTCRPAQVSSRHGPVTNCRPEPPCVVTDIPKRVCCKKRKKTVGRKRAKMIRNDIVCACISIKRSVCDMHAPYRKILTETKLITCESPLLTCAVVVFVTEIPSKDVYAQVHFASEKYL